MRKMLIAGNWKMNKTVPESLEFVQSLKRKLGSFSGGEVVLIPPFTSLFSVSETLRGSGIQLGAQNLSHLAKGAFTGEVSGAMLISAGCQYVLVGHSERRNLFHEDDALINQKLKAALSEGLHPIFCVGESGKDRESGKTENVISNQVKNGLDGLPSMEMRKTTIAYEPVWAIGTGKTAQPEQAQETHEIIRSVLSMQYGQEIADTLRVIYGGSVTPENSASLLEQPDVDGALVGGASLDADSFYAIIKSIN